MRFRCRLLLLSIIPFLTASFQNIAPERRVVALINLKDYQQACFEAEKIVHLEPYSKSAWEVYIKAFSKAGEERKAITAWNNFLNLFPDEEKNRELLETIAWGIIEKGTSSQSFLVRLYASLAAYLCQDARSIPILKKMFQDTSPQVRAVAVKLSSDYRDAILQDAILSLFYSEKNPQVRQEVIVALGKMKIKGSEQKLLSVLSDHCSSTEEKGAAITSLVNLMESINQRELQQLVSSNRASLRELACQVVSHTFDYEHCKLLEPLLKDCNGEVRRSAAYCFGLLRLCNDSLISLLDDPDPYVAITASWAVVLHDPVKGQRSFQKWLKHSNAEYRRFAAGALAATGKYGISMMKEVLLETSDSFVKVNVALGLLSQRKEIELAGRIVSQFLETTPDLIMWRGKGSIRTLEQGDIKLHPFIPGFPDAQNVSTRLELLHALSLVEYPQTMEVVRDFLKNRSWGVTGLAAALLLTEGEGDASEVVEDLIEDPDSRVQVQAALVLALWSGDDSVAPVLQRAYYNSDREMKERVLEGLGQIGSKHAIPLLVKALEEPSETLRILAAASLITSLYH